MITRSVVVSLGVLALLCGSPAMAQGVVDPLQIEFTPSIDHNVTLVGGLPAVSRYDAEFYVAGDLEPLEVVSLGKPTPEPDGYIRVAVPPASRIAGVEYEARVVAVGPNGANKSAPSNLFSFSGPCDFLLRPPVLALGAATGTGVLDVRSGAACLWTPTSSALWATVLTGSTFGNGQVNVAVPQNPDALVRSASLSVGSRLATILQAAAPCVYTVSPASISAQATGQNGSVNVSAPGLCAWTSTSAASWLLPTTAAGSGPGAALYSVTANASTFARSTVLTVAGVAVSVNQAGIPCAFTVTPATSTTFGRDGGSGSVNVTTGPSCGWTLQSSAPWLTITSSTTATGSGQARYRVSKNSTRSDRTAILTVAGRAVTILERR